jgi:hypothetical protein
MTLRKLGLLLGGVFVIAVVVCSAAAAASNTASVQQPQVISDTSLTAQTTTIGGATPLSTTRTVAHWFGSTLDPNNGVTYGYNMVGADPYNCSGSGCDATVETDIIPLNVIVGGMEFDGTDVVGPTLASPQFATNDYGLTPFATNSGFARGSGGVLSQGDAGNLLQLQDATMRAQFNRTGSSSYHLRLHPTVRPPITIVVPGNKGTLLQSGRGVIFASINVQWWATRIQNLDTSLGYIDPTHLPLYLTNKILLHIGLDPLNCCIIGFHGAGPVPSGNETAYGPGHGNGNQPIQTFAWASWVTPGIYARPSGGVNWALQDIHAISHEVAEWADDPFINNFVEPWLTPTAPQYGCTDTLETGDPVVDIGFAKGTNTFDQAGNPNGTQSADGFYHPEDEVFLPWFMRTAPNTVSEPTQSPSANIGRYTLMGDLNPFAGFRQPATGC